MYQLFNMCTGFSVTIRKLKAYWIELNKELKIPKLIYFLKYTLFKGCSCPDLPVSLHY